MLIKIENGISNLRALIHYKLLYGKKLKISKHVRFRKNMNISISKEGNIFIGEGTFFNNNCSINSRLSLYIGRNVLFGENVKIYDHNHRFNKKLPKFKQGFSCSPIKIEDNCWIGSNVVILKGVTVGKNSVIGAGVVLRHSVKPNTIVSFDENSLIKEQINFVR